MHYDQQLEVLSVQAAIIGNSFQPPLGIPSSDLGRKELIFSGQQGTVHRGSWKGQDVAIKRAKISSSADTQRLRSQVRQLLVLGQNDKICPLIAARLLPPGIIPDIPVLSISSSWVPARESLAWNVWLACNSSKFIVSVSSKTLDSEGILHLVIFRVFLPIKLWPKQQSKLELANDPCLYF